MNNEDKEIKELLDFKKLLNEGYFILRIKNDLKMTNNDIPSCSIYLVHKSKTEKIQFKTTNENVIKYAEDYYEYQNEPIGYKIKLLCYVVGIISNDSIKDLISKLNGLWDMEISLTKGIGVFEVIKNINSEDEMNVTRFLEKFECLLGFLAAKLRIGIFIRHRSIAKIPRIGLTINWGPVESLISLENSNDLNNFDSIYNNSKAMKAAQGLNRAYIEYQPSSRINRLWAAVEDIFGSDPIRMLTNKEINKLVEFAEEIDSLKNDNKRLIEIKKVLSDPNRLPKTSRNRRIADNIASIMNISKDEAYEMIKECSQLRGKHAHELTDDNLKKLKEANKFLENVLIIYFNKE
jgi:hypothetical protein